MGHPGDRGARDRVGRFEVEPQVEVPVRIGKVEERPSRLSVHPDVHHAGVVDENVDPPERLDHPVDHLTHLCAVGEVGDEPGGPHATTVQIRRPFMDPLRGRTEREGGSFPPHDPRRREPDPGGGAGSGDERHLVRELGVHRGRSVPSDSSGQLNPPAIGPMLNARRRGGAVAPEAGATAPHDGPFAPASIG